MESITPAPSLTPARERAVMWALLIGNFVIGSAILLPAGMLPELSAAFSVDVPRAGLLMLTSGVVVAVFAPVLAALTSRIDRRAVLGAALVLYVAAHLASMLAPTFEALIAARVVMALGAAVFTPQAAATLGALIPPERRAYAMTFVFIGWSLASVGGVPLGGFIAHEAGWQAAYALVAALSAAALAAVWLAVPQGVRIAPLNAQSWRAVISSPALLLVLLVTILNGSGQFTLFTYLAPSLEHSLGADATMRTLILAWFGLTATVGNFAASRMVITLGVEKSVLLTLLSMAGALLIWGLGSASLPLVLLAAAFWGLGNFATNSMQQARLASLAPHLASASIALNTSAIYIGQAIGSGLGGQLIRAEAISMLPYAGATILFLAAAVSVIAGRMGHPVR